MKKSVFLLLLFCFSAVWGQELKPVDAKDVYVMYVDGPGKGVATFYKLGKVTTFIDGATVGKRFVADTGMDLAGFAKNPEISGDVNSFIAQIPAVVYANEPKPPNVNVPGVGGYLSNWGKAQYRSIYGSSYEREKAELNNGDAFFEFNGQDVVYPAFGAEKPSTDELVVCALPTHSIVNFAGLDFVSAIEMKLIDEGGRVVWHLYDTKGGYHPQLKVNARGNNHPDDANRWLKYGRYRLWVKNMSTDSRALQTISFGTTKGTGFWTYLLSAGNENTYDLEIKALPDPFDVYKINCNVFTGPGGK